MINWTGGKEHWTDKQGVRLKLARAIGHAVVLDNRPGAGSTLGTADAAKAIRDAGSELTLASPTEFAKYLQTESRKWPELAKNSNISIE